MLEGLVQHDFPLTIGYLLRRLRTVHGRGEAVELVAEDGTTRRATYAEIATRADRLAAALRELGVQEGDRVGTFAWNTQRHLEAYLAIPAMGAVLHTLNIRLRPEQVAWIANHARDRVVLVDEHLLALWEQVAPHLETVEHTIVLGEEYEQLLARHDGAEPDFPDLDDRAAAALCYTSGTTGDPKGVLYSHRSSVLHALACCSAETFGIRAADRILPIVPMFHANAWGLPYAAALAGATLVNPGRFLQGPVLARLIETERVTVSGAVPTIWLDLLRYADAEQPDLRSLRLVLCGGSAVPRMLMEALQERHGVHMVQAWGMTETSPIGSVAHVPEGLEGEDAWAYRTSQGRLAPFVEARLIDDDGVEQPWDGESTGELEVRGPWVACAYFETETPEKFDDGWLRTGDIASITPDGFIRIRDRAKDVIKSGGEWISSVDLENELVAHPDVLEAAVIAVPDERWAERPLACVVVRDGAELPPEEVVKHLEPRVARFWLPDEIAFIDEVPKTSTGKFDKKVLRARLADGTLGQRVKVGRPAQRAEA